MIAARPLECKCRHFSRTSGAVGRDAGFGASGESAVRAERKVI
jgi:hypothetical protein